MADALRRRRCPQCQQMREFKDRQQRVCSVPCEVARRRAVGAYEKAQAIMRAKRQANRTRMTLEGFGRLTERELAIYERGRKNALVYARDKTRREARRQAWAEALGEHEGTPWRTRRTAA